MCRTLGYRHTEDYDCELLVKASEILVGSHQKALSTEAGASVGALEPMWGSGGDRQEGRLGSWAVPHSLRGQGPTACRGGKFEGL